MADLCTAEQLALWACRCWVEHHREGSGADALAAKGFARAGLEGCERHLDGLMAAFVAGLRRPFGIPCLHCPEVSPDEELLLRVLALAQAGDEYSASGILHRLLLPAAARIAIEPVSAIGEAMRRRNLVLHGTGREVEPEAPGFRSPDPGLHLVQ